MSLIQIDDAVLLAQILTERQRQRTIYSEKHDLEHDGARWAALLAVYLGKVAACDFGGGPREYQKRLIQLAALTMAALENEERRV